MAIETILFEMLSLLMSSLLFGEKINLRCIIGVVLSFAALLMINL